MQPGRQIVRAQPLRRAEGGNMRGYNNLSVCQYFSEDRAGGLRLLHFVYEPKPFDCTEFETTDCYFCTLLPKAAAC